MATAQQVAEFREANKSLATLAQRDLEDFWRSLNVAGSPEAVRDALLEFFPELVAAYGDAAAVLGADWYDALRDVPPSAAAFRAALADPASTEQAQGAVRFLVGPLFADEPDPASVLVALTGSAQRLILQAGRDTVATSATRDPVRTGWARQPSGRDTCQFCVLLASRGAVYGSQAAAGGPGNRYHDHCDCVQVIIRSRSDYPEDYDLELYKRLYAEGAGIGRDLPVR
jgi:hypothetical protein